MQFNEFHRENRSATSRITFASCNGKEICASWKLQLMPMNTAK
jgi:hypothetical protein